MRNTVLTAAIIMVATSGLSMTAAEAQAGGWSEFWHRFHVDFHRNNCWPDPFVHADRKAAMAPFAMMTHNGWRQQNTVSDDLFHHETHQLTHAGVLRVRWIVTQGPRDRRVVYVLQGPSQDATERRVDAVQQTIARIVPHGKWAPVVLTSKVPLSGSGDYFDQIDRRVRSTIPTPRLPEPTGSLDGGG